MLFSNKYTLRFGQNVYGMNDSDFFRVKCCSAISIQFQIKNSEKSLFSLLLIWKIVNRLKFPFMLSKTFKTNNSLQTNELDKLDDFPILLFTTFYVKCTDFFTALILKFWYSNYSLSFNIVNLYFLFFQISYKSRRIT